MPKSYIKISENFHVCKFLERSTNFVCGDWIMVRSLMTKGEISVQ